VGRRRGQRHERAVRARCQPLCRRGAWGRRAPLIDLGRAACMTLAGRSAIITGASLGLGAEISRQFAAAGASLMLCARNVTELDAQAERLKAAYPNTQIVTQRADIASPADVEALFAAAINVFGKLDILVNNAGVYGPMGSIEATDWDAWVEAIAINLTGTVYCVRKAVEAFKPRRYGKIINLSGGGATNPLPGISA